MKNKILVPINSIDSIADLVPSIAGLTQPGMKVVFLQKFAIEDRRGVLKLCAKMDEGITDGSAFRQLAEIHSSSAMIERAEVRLAPAVSALKAKGVEATVAFYEGSLSKALQQHSGDGDACWVMSRRGIPSWIAGFLGGRNSLVDLISRPAAQYAAKPS